MEMKKMFLAVFLVLFFGAGAVFPSFVFNNTINGSDYGKYGYNSVKFPYAVGVMGEGLYVIDSDKNNLAFIKGDSLDRSYGSAITLSSPKAFAFDGQNVIIADTGNSKLRLLRGGSLTELQLTMGQGLKGPQGVFAYEGMLYVSDTENSRIVVMKKGASKYSYEMEIGSSGSSDGQVKNPAQIFISEGLLYVADTGNNRIEVFSLNGTYQKSIGTGKGGVSLLAPEGVFAGDYVFVSDTGNNRVVAFTKSGEPVGIIDKDACGNGACKFASPRGIWANGSMLYVADTWNSRVQVFKINITTGNERILGLLNALDAHVAQENVLKGFAEGNLGLSARGTGSACTAAARESYSRLEFSVAESQIADCNQTVQSEIALLQNTIASTLQAKISIEEGRVSSLKEKKGIAQESITSVESQLAQAKNSIAAKDYQGALPKISEAKMEIDALLGLNEEKGEEDGAGGGDSGAKIGGSAEIVLERLSLIEKKIAAIESESSAYVFDSGIGGAKLAAGQISIYLENSQIASAQSSLNELERLVAFSESKLVQRKSESMKAEEKVNASHAIISNIAKGSILFAPDMAEANAKLSQAREFVYSDPAKAVLLSGQAEKIANDGKASSGNLELLAGGVLLVMAAVIAMLGAIAYILFKIWKQKRPGSRGINWHRDEPKKEEQAKGKQEGKAQDKGAKGI